MDKLEPPDSQHLRAAEGWLELGNHQEANAELERITPELRSHPDVLEVRWHVCAHSQDWEACVEIAAATVRLAPGRPGGWVHCSFALHELRRTQEAVDSLLPVAQKFRKTWTIPYNLSCYCAQLGRLEESGKRFKKALAVHAQAVQRAAVDDPDLKPLWDSMGGTFWKRT
jgi:hypothetical protein